MKASFSHPDLPYQAAAEWFMRVRSADPSLAELQEWTNWLKVEEHQRAFDAVTRAWQAADGVERPASSRVRRRFALAAVILMAAAGTTWVGKWAFDAWSSRPYTTAKAEQRSMRLSDGSRVTLGAQSGIKPEFAAHDRRVELTRGEAFFEVVPDPRRPFVVIAGTSTIRVLGTAFNVRATVDRVSIGVTEGRVVVTSASGARVALDAGQQATLDNQGQISQSLKPPAEIATWREGRLLYRAERLDQVAEDINRYSNQRIAFEDDAARELLFSGTIQQDHVDEWLRGLADIFPVSITREPDRIVIRTHR